MNSTGNGSILSHQQQNKTVQYSAREFLLRYVYTLPWFVASMTVCFLVAYIYLRYTTPIYTSNGRMLMKKQSSNGARDRFDDIFLIQGTSNLNDEIEQIKSTSIARRVVKALNLQVAYYNKGNIKAALLTADQSPVKLETVKLRDTMGFYATEITILDDHRFVMNETKKELVFGQPFEVNHGIFVLDRTALPLQQFTSKIFNISWQPSYAVARNLAARIGISQSNDFSNVLTLTFESENPRLSQYVVNAFMYAYEQASLEDKKQIAINTLVFIEDQLDTLRLELGGVEKNLQNFREKNKVLAVTEQSSLFLGNANEFSKQIRQVEVKMKVLDYLTNYIGNERNQYKIVPSNLGIDEPTLLQFIGDYNRMQLQRETFLKTMPAANPAVVQLEAAIAKLRSDMLESLHNVRQSYLVTLSGLQQQNKNTESSLVTIPSKEKRLLEITRQQKILEELYSFLLQKKLETAIASASTVSNSRVIEEAYFSDLPIKPKHSTVYTIAVFIGLAVPLGVISLKELLNDKVRTKSDVERVTRTPVLGEVGHSENASFLIVSANNRSYVAEQFRIIRSNFQYLVPKNEKPVILVTSSFSGEGKSFISTNLGGVLALSGKKTLILEFDIRKPKILKGMGLTESKGITNFIVGNLDLNRLLIKVPETENLYVIPCGPIPPNPAELLLDPKVAEIFEFAHANFDAIVVDTAPVGLVGDAITLSKFTNTSVYIIRYNYTYKNQVHLIEELYQQNKLNRMALVINDVRIQNGYGYYGHGYGYGYGYGVERHKTNGYFNIERKKKSNFFRKR